MKISTVSAVFVILAFGCEEPTSIGSLVSPNSVSPQAVDPDNILFFPDPESMLEYVAFVNDKRSGKVEAGTFRTHSDRFVSFNEAYENVVDALSSAQTEHDADHILTANSDILILEDDTYVPSISMTLYGDICNRDGIYQAGDQLNKIVNDQYIVSANVGDLSELVDIESVENLDREKYSVISIGNTFNNSSSGCGDFLLKDYFENNSGCKNDRRVWIRARTYFSYFNRNFYFPWTEIYQWGERRKWNCQWIPYFTELNSRNVSFTVNSFSLENPNWGWTTLNRAIRSPFSATLPDSYSGTNTAGRHIYNGPSGALLHVEPWQTQPIRNYVSPLYGFTSIRVEASSRGTNNNWAVVSCN